jgi:hypothetical protein
LGEDRNEEKAVRDLILKMSMSVDGFVSDLDGANKWMFGADQEAKAWAVETTWNASLHIMGSRSFLAMANYWPTSTDVFAPPMNQIPKAVFSRQGLAILRNVNTAALNDARANAAAGQPAARQSGPGTGRPVRPGGAPRGAGQRLAAVLRTRRANASQLMSSRAFPGGAVAQIYRPA